ncbi:hypothetical protein BCAMP_09480 [Brochothrix campestris FSL F6-1037]|uniref:Uncharacterized protein n=1 Tax=Brochothrix campestris FSL F6-1037 TaxID=1265861 RepID=W7CEI5_9LIST|nr:hypothetical protein BCAMP_09480 [Brochothrix campestris FSL F6-1037]
MINLANKALIRATHREASWICVLAKPCNNMGINNQPIKQKQLKTINFPGNIERLSILVDKKTIKTITLFFELKKV